MLIPRDGGHRSNQLANSYEVLARQYRKLFLLGPIIFERTDSWSALQVSADIEYLSRLDPAKHIELEISSPGGVVSLGIEVVGKMGSSFCGVWTFGNGVVASIAAVILACGERGKRFLYPNCKVMIHLPSAMLQGDSDQLKKQAEEIQRDKYMLAEILALQCGQSKERVIADMGQELWMNAEEARAYGLADHIIAPRSFPGILDQG